MQGTRLLALHLSVLGVLVVCCGAQMCADTTSTAYHKPIHKDLVPSSDWSLLKMQAWRVYRPSTVALPRQLVGFGLLADVPYLVRCPYNESAHGEGYGLLGPRLGSPCTTHDVSALTGGDDCHSTMGIRPSLEIAPTVDAAVLMCGNTNGSTTGFQLISYDLLLDTATSAYRRTNPPLLEPCLAIEADITPAMAYVVANRAGMYPEISAYDITPLIVHQLSVDGRTTTAYAATGNIAIEPVCGFDHDVNVLTYLTRDPNNDFYAWSFEYPSAFDGELVGSLPAGSARVTNIARMDAATNTWVALASSSGAPSTAKSIRWTVSVAISGTIADVTFFTFFSPDGGFLAALPSAGTEMGVYVQPGVPGNELYYAATIHFDASPSIVTGYTFVSVGTTPNTTRILTTSTTIEETLFFAEQGTDVEAAFVMLAPSTQRPTLAPEAGDPNPPVLSYTLGDVSGTPLAGTPPFIVDIPSFFSAQLLDISSTPVIHWSTEASYDCESVYLDFSGSPDLSYSGSTIYLDVFKAIGTLVEIGPGHWGVTFNYFTYHNEVTAGILSDIVAALRWQCALYPGDVGPVVTAYRTNITAHVELWDGRGLCSGQPYNTTIELLWVPGTTDYVQGAPPLGDDGIPFTRGDYSADGRGNGAGGVSAGGMSVFPFLSFWDSSTWDARAACIGIGFDDNSIGMLSDDLFVRPGNYEAASGDPRTPAATISHSVTTSPAGDPSLVNVNVDSVLVGKANFSRTASSARLTVCFESAPNPVLMSVVNAVWQSLTIEPDTTVGGVRSLLGAMWWNWDPALNVPAQVPASPRWAIDVSVTAVESGGVCGDGTRDHGSDVAVEDREACDDGNTVDGDGCSGLCVIEPNSVCDLTVEPNECRATHAREEEAELLTAELEAGSSTAISGYVLVITLLLFAMLSLHKRYKNKLQAMSPGFTKASLRVKMMRDHSLMGVIAVAPGDPFSRLGRAISLFMQLMLMLATSVIVMILFEDTVGSIMNIVCSAIISTVLSLTAGPGLLQSGMRMRIDGEYGTSVRRLMRPISFAAGVVWCVVLAGFNAFAIITGDSLLPGKYASFHKNVLSGFLSSALFSLFVIEPVVIVVRKFIWLDNVVWGAHSATTVAPQKIIDQEELGETVGFGLADAGVGLGLGGGAAAGAATAAATGPRADETPAHTKPAGNTPKPASGRGGGLFGGM